MDPITPASSQPTSPFRGIPPQTKTPRKRMPSGNSVTAPPTPSDNKLQHLHRGSDTALHTNSFAISIQDCHIFAYTFTTTPESNAKRHVFNAWKKQLPTLYLATAIFDGFGTVYLPYLVDITAISYVTIMDEDVATHYKVSLAKPSSFDLKDVRAFIQSESKLEISHQVQQGLSFIDAVLVSTVFEEESPKSKSILSTKAIDSNFPGGLKLVRNWQVAVEYTCSELLLNVGVTTCLVFNQGSIAELAAAYLKKPNLESEIITIGSVEYEQLSGFLSGLFVVCTSDAITGALKIFSLSEKFDRTKYFTLVPLVSCINQENVVSLHRMEDLMVLGQQTYVGPLTDAQKLRMSLAPDDRFRLIENGIMLLQAKKDFLARWGMSVESQMKSVNANIMKVPRMQGKHGHVLKDSSFSSELADYKVHKSGNIGSSVCAVFSTETPEAMKKATLFFDKTKEACVQYGVELKAHSVAEVMKQHGDVAVVTIFCFMTNDITHKPAYQSRLLLCGLRVLILFRLVVDIGGIVSKELYWTIAVFDSATRLTTENPAQFVKMVQNTGEEFGMVVEKTRYCPSRRGGHSEFLSTIKSSRSSKFVLCVMCRYRTWNLTYIVGTQSLDPEYCHFKMLDLLMLINSKLGGINFVTDFNILSDVSQTEGAMFVAGTIMHPPQYQGQASIGSVVASMDKEIITNLSSKFSGLLKKFETKLRAPSRVIYFRDGVLEENCSYVAKREVDIMKGALKNHGRLFFQKDCLNSKKEVDFGTVVNSGESIYFGCECLHV
ncbi:hypothetical protein BCR33DRAFT_715444 [Rhizoclosmatium globosum]|uniref:Piwi domain-containing protein n=1 Tax=Rhizoclosmatium globosum TaxID=329046 RepID=A0A1Y2CGZ3_9FUNG|nr:hypothetical protein BCR33DRAFT_715444 [Rhizoclosmatium globosum]|eukprot:ORY46321.1 hypothetical protein BCR33DRAFT_715444 [Rhizoclosmatium globosum]